jgi:hypothetical protein
MRLAGHDNPVNLSSFAGFRERREAVRMEHETPNLPFRPNGNPARAGACLPCLPRCFILSNSKRFRPIAEARSHIPPTLSTVIFQHLLGYRLLNLTIFQTCLHAAPDFSFQLSTYLRDPALPVSASNLLHRFTSYDTFSS